MEGFLKKILTDRSDDEDHKYLIRFGKGNYERRFLTGYSKSGDKVKIKTSFEFANDLVKFVRESKEVLFSGKILTKEKIPGKEGKNQESSWQSCPDCKKRPAKGDAAPVKIQIFRLSGGMKSCFCSFGWRAFSLSFRFNSCFS